MNAMINTIDELITIDILELIAIVEFIAMSRLSRDTHTLYKGQLPQHLVSVALKLSTRKVVSLSPIYC